MKVTNAFSYDLREKLHINDPKSVIVKTIKSTETEKGLNIQLFIKENTHFKLINMEFMENELYKENNDKYVQFETLLTFFLDENLLDFRAILDISNNRFRLFLFGLTHSSYIKYQIALSGDITRIFQVKTPVPIKDFGSTKHYPYYNYVVDNNNDITFYSMDGDLLTRFIIKNFLRNLPENVYDFSKIKVGIRDIAKRVFLIIIEKYMFLIYIEFDKKQQIFTIKILKKEEFSNDIYLARVPKTIDDSVSPHIYLGNKNSSLAVVGFKQIKFFPGASFEDIIFHEQKDTDGNPNYISDNISIKMMKSKSIFSLYFIF